MKVFIYFTLNIIMIIKLPFWIHSIDVARVAQYLYTTRFAGLSEVCGISFEQLKNVYITKAVTKFSNFTIYDKNVPDIHTIYCGICHFVTTPYFSFPYSCLIFHHHHFFWHQELFCLNRKMWQDHLSA